MDFFYHYTERSGFSGVKAGAKASNVHGGYLDDDDDEASWRPMVNQPQKHMRAQQQHAEGFYLTNISPAKLGNKESAKLGININIEKDEAYVFVFRAEGSQRSGWEVSGRTLQGEYATTFKWYLKASGVNEKADSILRLDRAACIWCGPVARCPTEQQLKERLQG